MKTTINRFRQYLEAERVSTNTIQSYLHSTIQLMNYLEKDFQNIEPADYLMYSGYLLHECKVKPATYNVKLMAIKKMIKFHEEMEWPCALKYDFIKQIPPKSTRKHGLNDSDLSKLMGYKEKNKFKQARNVALIHVLYSTGMRISELAALDVSSINPEMKKNPTVDDIPSAIDVVGKGEKERTVFLSNDAKLSLVKYIKERNNIPGAKKQEKLFISLFRNQACHLSRESLNTIIKNRGLKVGVKVTPHLLRHTLGVNLLNTPGVNIKEVAEVLGHTSVNTTQNYVVPSDTALFNKMTTVLNTKRKKMVA